MLHKQGARKIGKGRVVVRRVPLSLSPAPGMFFAPVFTTILGPGTGYDTKSGFPVSFFPESLGMLKALS